MSNFALRGIGIGVFNRGSFALDGLGIQKLIEPGSVSGPGHELPVIPLPGRPDKIHLDSYELEDELIILKMIKLFLKGQN